MILFDDVPGSLRCLRGAKQREFLETFIKKSAKHRRFRPPQNHSGKSSKLIGISSLESSTAQKNHRNIILSPKKSSRESSNNHPLNHPRPIHNPLKHLPRKPPKIHKAMNNRAFDEFFKMISILRRRLRMICSIIFGRWFPYVSMQL